MANLILAIDLTRESHPLIHSENYSFRLTIELKGDLAERTCTHVRYRQREVRWRNLLRRRRSNYPTESPSFQDELGRTGSRRGQSYQFGRGSRTTVRNMYMLTSMSYGSVQLHRGGCTADAEAVQLRWGVLGCWKLSSVSSKAPFARLGEFVY